MVPKWTISLPLRQVYNNSSRVWFDNSHLRKGKIWFRRFEIQNI